MNCLGDVDPADGIDDACIGACCFTKAECGDRTLTDCEDQGGEYQGGGTRCPTQDVYTVYHRSGPVVHSTDPAFNCYDIGDSKNGCIEGYLIDAWMTAEEEMCHSFNHPGECSPPIPADFFGAGSDAYNGQVCLEGVPLGDMGVYGSYEVADTLILQAADPFDRCVLTYDDPVEVLARIVALRVPKNT